MVTSFDFVFDFPFTISPHLIESSISASILLRPCFLPSFLILCEILGWAICYHIDVWVLLSSTTSFCGKIGMRVNWNNESTNWSIMKISYNAKKGLNKYLGSNVLSVRCTNKIECDSFVKSERKSYVAIKRHLYCLLNIHAFMIIGWTYQCLIISIAAHWCIHILAIYIYIFI